MTVKIFDKLSMGGTGTLTNSIKLSNSHRIKGIGYKRLSVRGYVIVEYERRI